MKMLGKAVRVAIAGCVTLGVGGWLGLAAQEDGSAAAVRIAREWRQTHERQILEEYVSLLRVPNVSRDAENIRRNADLLLDMMRRRGVNARLLEQPAAAPVVYGEIVTPGATNTYVFYAHYDGQPVDPREWATPPFDPVLRTARLDKGGAVATLPAAGTALDPEWRIYARSASDDKAQIFAMLSALDALKAAGLKPRANIKFVFEGEEEIGSAHLGAVLSANKSLLQGSLWLMCDGPVHQSGRPTVVFGARGIQRLDITVYGPRGELHSGHYGNWAPNPAQMLAELLASMKDGDGRVRVEHFYDGVAPLSALERQAIAAAPGVDAELMRDMWLSRTEGGGKTLAELINLPSLNIRGFASGHVGAQAANVIPSSATAAIDLRLVKGVGHQQQADRVMAHIRRQGYYVTTSEPDQATRLAHPKVAWVAIEPSGYDAVRTPMDLPAAQRIIAAVRSVRSPIVLLPTEGGSVPLATIEDILGVKTISVPIANYDNSQHSANENIRLGHFWDGIETQAALLTME